ncbi:MAG TPA: hypothetical protein VK428_06840 [Acidimicrobiales bacterium]|nr:hypothetical protein [Acidimicrobiales bacterium]
MNTVLEQTRRGPWAPVPPDHRGSDDEPEHQARRLDKELVADSPQA